MNSISSCIVLKLSFSLIIVTSCISANAQSELFPTGQNLQLKLGKRIYFDSARVNHTAIQRYFTNELSTAGVSQDSLLRSLYPERMKWQKDKWLYRKLFAEHLIEIKKKDHYFYLNFLPDLQVGTQNGHRLWLNTRGVEVGLTIGKKFAVTSYIFENQGKFPAYLNDYIQQSRVVPGQGLVRPYGNGGFDYGYSGGTLSYTPSKYLNLQLGYDKNFIGDGYRSLLLSDNSYNYPYAKAIGTLGNVRYMVMLAQFIDFTNVNLNTTPFPKKYSVFHYLSWNVNKRLSLGLFENITWIPRGFEFSYFVPIMILRPAEFANGSPDKALYGINASYKFKNQYVAYGQLMVNEFVLKEMFNRSGYWGNKQGVQLGIKGFDLFKVNNLEGQLEMNTVRPYSYSANDPKKNYGHYGQPLAHPLGANFKEYLGIFNYRYQNFDARLQFIRASYGLDVGTESNGKDIYKSYFQRTGDYGAFIGQGLKTRLRYHQLIVAYILNPKNNLRIEVGYTHRRESNIQYTNTQQIFNIGLRSSFRNIYNDF
jgi:hypothetical protein